MTKESQLMERKYWVSFLNPRRVRGFCDAVPWVGLLTQRGLRRSVQGYCNRIAYAQCAGIVM